MWTARFEDLSIRTKISILLGAILLFVLLVLVFAFRQMNRIERDLNAVVHENIPLLQALGQVTSGQYRRAIHLVRAIHAGRRLAEDGGIREKFREHRREIDRIDETLHGELNGAIELVQDAHSEYSGSGTRRETLLRVDYELRGVVKEYADYRFVSERALNLFALGRRQKAEQAVARMGRERQQLDRALDRLVSRVQKFSSSTVGRAAESQETAVITLSVISGIGFMVAVGIGVLIVFHISRPLKRAAGVARQISSGNRDLEIEVTTGDETGELLGAMREMLRSVRETEQELRRREALYRTVVNNIPQKVFMKDRQSRYVSINDNFARDLGIEPEQAVGKEDSDFFPPELAEKYRSDDRWIMSEGITNEYDEKYMDEGERRIVHTTKTPVRDEDGQVVGVLGIFRDVTQQRRARQKLQETLEELERSNQELEHFAYVVSHDLQEPLRMVTSYVQLLQKRYEGKLDSDADDFIDFAVDGTRRMQQMINDLLQYSRVGTRGKPFRPTDCNEVIDKVLQNLEVAVDEAGAEISCGRLPTVEADESQLLQLFQNLVSNAIKFRSGAPPRVRIEAEKRENDWLFSVSDNGIGMEPGQADRIFKVFQRLHEREEYPGTGIGLAICKRIVERHGGQIWVESEPGEGSTFYFTIPRKVKQT